MEQQHNLHKKAAVLHIDYKDITSLANYINPHARMNSRRRTGFTAKQQRDLTFPGEAAPGVSSGMNRRLLRL